MGDLSVLLLCLFGLMQAAPPSPHPAVSQQAQKGAPASASKNSSADYSHEPFVVQQFYTQVRFQNDGTGERSQSARIVVQDDSGVQQLKELVFAYNAANESVDIHFVRVRKPNGTVIAAGAKAAKDVTPPSVRDAPAYSNYKEKHVVAPGLQPGDTLEYDITVLISTPFAPNEFWYEQTFISDAIVLDERLYIDLPQGRTVMLESPDFAYEKTEANGRTIYRWKHANLAHLHEEASQEKPEEAESKAPSVQVTTFASWNAMSHWYASLEKSRIEPDAEIRAKTQELIASRSSKIDRVRALYDYVAKNIRFVSLPFGVAGYQPHPAAEVLKNQYGDGKDKQTLFAAMLESAGIPSDTVLVPSLQSLDRTLPSPAQFGHVITAVRNAGEFIWMDSTTGVAPFQFLAGSLRNRQALLIAPDGSEQIVKTPADPPFLSTQRVEIEGQVSDLGKLTANLRYFLRGDNGFALRLAFQQAPQSEWKQLGQTLLSLDGIKGEVASVKPGDPTDTRAPFELNIEYSQLNFLDWSAKKSKVALPLLTIGLPQIGADNAAPIHLGSPLDVNVSLKLVLPAAFAVQPPVGTAIQRDFADFQSRYRFENHTLTAERTLNFKMRELPVDRTNDYLAFTAAVESDESQPLIAQNAANGALMVPASAQAGELFESGAAAMNAGNLRSAILLLERAVNLDPKHDEAWKDLGLSYFRAGKPEEATRAFRKQIDVNPHDAQVHNYLGAALQERHKSDEAASAFRAQIELNPLDTVAHAALGDILLEQHRYAEAIPELDKATILSPDNAALQISLGQAYFGDGQGDKALSAFEKSAEMSRSPAVWNAVARDLSSDRLGLDKAMEYAQSAVDATSKKLHEVDLSRVTPADFAEVAHLGTYWDALGWAYFQNGDLDRAERYVRSAWLLDESGDAADHLGQIYEKRAKTDDAIHAYALAVAAFETNSDARRRLASILGIHPNDKQIDALVARVRPKLRELRTIKAGPLLNENAEADFALLFSPGGANTKVDAVRFLSGSPKLRPFAHRLRLLEYGAVFPDISPAAIVRRGTLSCSTGADTCTFVLALPEDVRGAN